MRIRPLLAVGVALAAVAATAGVANAWVGGTAVPEDRWMATVTKSDGQCSGTLINQSWVLTSAGCLPRDPDGGQYAEARVWPNAGVRFPSGETRKVTFIRTVGLLSLLGLSRPVAGAGSTLLAVADPPVGARTYIYGTGDRNRWLMTTATVKSVDAVHAEIEAVAPDNVEAEWGDMGGGQFVLGGLVGVVTTAYTSGERRVYSSSVARNRTWILSTAATSPPPGPFPPLATPMPCHPIICGR